MRQRSVDGLPANHSVFRGISVTDLELSDDLEPGGFQGELMPLDVSPNAISVAGLEAAVTLFGVGEHPQDAADLVLLANRVATDAAGAQQLTRHLPPVQ